MDYDYVHKLSPEEKQWLANFTDEHYNASVGKQDDEGKNNNLYKSRELVKDAQTRNNKRNNDVYGKARASRDIVGGDYNSVSDFIDTRVDNTVNSTEDAIIDILDACKDLNQSGTDTD